MTRNDKGAGKTECFLGISDPFRLLLTQGITRPGLEPVRENTGETALSENGGTPGGTLATDSEPVASLRQQALDDLQRAWKSIRRMETLSDDPAESKVAERALALVDRAFEELEGGKR